MTVKHDGIPLWAVEIEAVQPVVAVALIAAPTWTAAVNAAREMDVTSLDFEPDGFALSGHGPRSVRPAIAQDEPHLIVRGGDA